LAWLALFGSVSINKKIKEGANGPYQTQPWPLLPQQVLGAILTWGMLFVDWEGVAGIVLNVEEDRVQVDFVRNF
jgi:hypothetical protein